MIPPVAGIELASSLEQALAGADFVSLHAPMIPENRHLVRDETLALMKRAPVLVNTSRGGLVDLAAVTAALDDGRLAGVALDVTEPEPLPADHPLRSHPRAIVTPHMAFYSAEAQDELKRRSADEIAPRAHRRAAAVAGERRRDRSRSTLSAVPAAIYPDLAGKTAFVTGGSKGIGAATCRLLAENGAKVAVVARGLEAAEELAAELRRDGAEAIALSADCTAPEQVGRARAAAEERLGPVGLLVPFAGGFESFTPVAEMTVEEFRTVVDDNLTSTFITVRAFLPAMIERRSGAIVTMSSISARFLDKLTQAAYAAAKAGVIMFTRHLAIEVGEHGIRANCVAPGTTMSERIERVMTPEAIDYTAALSPLRRLGAPGGHGPCDGVPALRRLRVAHRRHDRRHGRPGDAVRYVTAAVRAGSIAASASR